MSKDATSTGHAGFDNQTGLRQCEPEVGIKDEVDPEGIFRNTGGMGDEGAPAADYFYDVL